MTTYLQDAWALLQFGFIIMVIIIALWRMLHGVAREIHTGSSRLGEWLGKRFNR